VDFENALFQQAYHSIFSAIGQRDGGNFITRDEFATKGFCLYLFELLPNIDASQIYADVKALLRVSYYLHAALCILYSS
jgi:hypothetical protein